jgi:hypothetical protein
MLSVMIVWVLAGAGALVAARVVARRRPAPASMQIEDPPRSTTIGEDGAVRSVQAAKLVLPAADLERIWSPKGLEQLARTYWRFLTRVTLGLIRVKYTETTRTVALLFRPLKLLRFQAPEYAMDQTRGIVRWPIEDGVLVARRGCGYLQIDVRRLGAAPNKPGYECLYVAVEVANFYPAIAHRLSRWIYTQTQSRIHVIVTHGFLRSLRRLDLARSRVGRFAGIDEVPNPPLPGEGSLDEGLRHPNPVG